MWPSQEAAELALTLSLAVEACGASGVALAVSGGRDSTLLLHLSAAELKRERSAGRLRVLHVDHGVRPERALWRRRVEEWSAALGLPVRVLEVGLPVPPGQSPEAWLREQRYRLLAGALSPGEAVLTAHHLDDQAETFLLQGLRGCGPAGLAAMPVRAALGSGSLLRPWLGFPREVLRRASGAMGIDGFDDPSNQDEAFDRSFLRQRVMPAIVSRWPAASRALGRSARWQAECVSALDEAAGLLLPGIVDTDGEGGSVIAVSRLLQFGAPLARVLLRAWLAQCGAQPPGLRHVEAIEALLRVRADAQGEVCWKGMRVRRYRDALYFDGNRKAEAFAQGSSPTTWRPPERLELPQGQLTVRLEHEGAQRLAVASTPCMVGTRRGGELIRPAGDRHTRTLKALLQRASVPPWRRRHQPLVYREGRLVAVPGLCVAEEAAAREGEPGWVIEWLRATATGRA